MKVDLINLLLKALPIRSVSYSTLHLTVHVNLLYISGYENMPTRTPAANRERG